MEKPAQFNVAYVIFAVFAILLLLLPQWWQQSQTVEVVPYSEFEQLLKEGKISEVLIGEQRVTGKL